MDTLCIPRDQRKAEFTVNVRARRHVGDPRSGFVIALLLTIASQPRPCRLSAMIVDARRPIGSLSPSILGS
jgi:hypothetical protein